MNRYLTLAVLLCLLASCGAQAAPTPDMAVLREQVKQEVLAELTASAPTATLTPVPTPSAAPTSTPTKTPVPTATATSTESATPAPTLTPTATPQPATATATVAPSRTKLPPTGEPTRMPPATQTAAPTHAPAALPAPTLAGTIAFAAYEPAIGGYTLYTFTADRGLRSIAHHVHQPDISLDGKLIAVDGAGAGREDLWAVDMNGGNWQQLTHYLDDHYPNWSPVWMEFGFSSSRQGDGVYRLFLGEELITTDRTPFIVGDYPILLLTRDMVFASCDYGWGTGSNCGVCVVTDGQLPRQLTHNPLDVPTDANMENVLFLRPDGDNWDIYRIGYAGGAPVPLSPSPGRDGPAALSPDGKAIAFLSDRSGTWALYRMNLQGEQVRKIVDLPAGLDFDHAPYPWWSERLSWGTGPINATATPTPVGGPLLPAPKITFPIPDDTVSTRRPTDVRWSWSQTLAANQGFQVRFWHTAGDNRSGVAAPTTDTHSEVYFGMTDAYRLYGDDFFYLDVVVVQLDPFRVLSEGTPIRVKTDPNK
jgi:hypothetical protein